ncbi:MAG: DsrE family protein [Candidatus Caldarchaeum sp.]|nr:DsrE family protein [Candidatus Caldarchaeum sp.]
MNDSRLLFVIISGPDQFEKARQALRIARNTAKERHAKEVRILFLGPGAKLLDPDNPHYDLVRKYASEMKEAGVYMAVCAGNLRAYGLYEKFDKTLFIADDSTAVVAEAASNKFIIMTF